MLWDPTHLAGQLTGSDSKFQNRGLLIYAVMGSPLASSPYSHSFPKKGGGEGGIASTPFPNFLLCFSVPATPPPPSSPFKKPLCFRHQDGLLHPLSSEKVKGWVRVSLTLFQKLPLPPKGGGLLGAGRWQKEPGFHPAPWPWHPEASLWLPRRPPCAHPCAAALLARQVWEAFSRANFIFPLPPGNITHNLGLSLSLRLRFGDVSTWKQEPCASDREPSLLSHWQALTP